MTLQIVKGNLFGANLPAIAHGCNCKGFMGAGIAAAVRKLWPGNYHFYKELCNNGEFQLGDFACYPAPSGPLIYNLATQDNPGPDARLWALEASLSAAMEDCKEREIEMLGVPWICAGIGGLGQEEVRGVFETINDSSIVDLVVYEL